MRHWRAVILVFLPFVAGYYLSYLFRTVNALIAGKLTSDLGLTAADLGLLTSVYFLTFGAMQLPLGVWLDRYGPRRVQSMLLAVAAVGTALFGLAEGFAPLVVGRALMGVGVAGALMAGLKAIVLWFPKERVALINGWFVTIGALGAVTATAPAEWLLPLTGWRGLFLGLAPIAALCAVAIYFVVPELHTIGRTLASSRSIGLKAIYSDPRFWRLAPLSATCIGTSWALQGLWAASWLTDVERLERTTVVRHLFVMATALCVAALGLGVAADRLRRHGVRPQTLLGVITVLFIAAQFALVLRWPLPSYLLWSIIAGVGTGTVLSYAMLAEYFPKEMTGRANGALNMFHLTGAFITQWATGLIVQQWTSHDGHYPAIAYQAALAFNLALQVVALLWFVSPGRLAPRRTSLSLFRRAFSIEISHAVHLARGRKSAMAVDNQPRSTDPQALKWRRAALGSAMLCGLLSLSLAITAGRAAVLGHRADVTSAIRANEPPNSQITYFLARFIKNARSLSSDPIVVRANWLSAYAYVTDRGAEALNNYAREVDPFTMVGMRTVSVEVISVVRLSDHSFAIRWMEEFFENGLRMMTETFTGVVIVVFEPPGPDTLMVNPLGLYIHAIEWSGARSKQDRVVRVVR